MKSVRLLLFSLSVILLVSCGKPSSGNHGTCLVTVVYAVNGLGDRSYTDGIYRGVCQFEHEFASSGVNMENHSPESMEVAETVIDRWFKGRSEVLMEYDRKILVLASNDYRDLFLEHQEWKEYDRGDVLMLDVSDPLPSPWEDVFIRNSSLYGMSYVTGYNARLSGIEKAAVVSANPEMKRLREGTDGFADGFRSAGGEIDESDVFYLGEGEFSGFRETDRLYSMGFDFASDGYGFVFPCCGGSIHGLMRYAREYPGRLKFCGMDADMQSLSADVVLSLVKDMGSVVYDFLERWLNRDDQDRFLVHMLDSRFMKVTVSDNYAGNPQWVVSTALFNEALAAEKDYLGL